MAEDAGAVGPITNDDQLLAWLKVAEPRQRATFYSHCALLTLPNAMEVVDQVNGQFRGAKLLLAALRACFIASIASNQQHSNLNDLNEAARSADAAAVSGGLSALSTRFLDSNTKSAAALSAALSADYARSVHSAAFIPSVANLPTNVSKYLDRDRIRTIAAGWDIVHSTWDGATNPKGSQSAWDRFQLRKDPEKHWDFWIKWYQSILEGQPLDWDLQRRIALEITDEEWSEGPGTVARRIREIETQYLKDTTRAVEDPHDPGEVSARHKSDLPKLILSRVNVAPPLVESPNSEKLTLAKEDGPATDPIQFAVNNIKMALDHALKTCGENGFDASVEEVGILKLALEGAPREARYIAPLLHHAYCVLDRKLKNGEYPSEESLSFLTNQLKAHVISLSKDKPDVAEHIQSYGDLPEPEPVPAEVVEDLQDAADKLEPVLEADAREVVDEVTERLEPGAVPSKYSWALIVQWFAQIWLYLDKAKKHLGIADWIWDILKKLF